MKQKNETNQVLGNIRLSMSDYVKGLAKARANICFSGNVSAYIAHLILQDVEKNISQENAPTATGSGNVVATDNAKVKNKTKLKK